MSTFTTLKRLVMSGMGGRVDGETSLAVERAINDAHKAIARVKDFDDLIVLDTTNAVTVAYQKLYRIETNLLLVRPKDVYSIRYMDESNSRKLIYVPSRELDEKVPYTEQSSYGRPTYYTRRGKYIELYRIPDEAKPLYIQHSQWPLVLVNGSDESSYSDNLDDIITGLSVDIANAILDGAGTGVNWVARAKQMLGLAESEEEEQPDKVLVAQPFDPTMDRTAIGSYWDDPFIKGVR